MENLLQNLQRTIKALETLSAKGPPQAELVEELLDQLFQQKIDLLNLVVNPPVTACQHVAQAFGQAAIRAEKAAHHPAQTREMISAITDAIDKLAKLLNSVG